VSAEKLDQPFNVQIFATDIDADAIAIARVGITRKASRMM
jgi:chemotaxis methyl-accepting protein methylase